MNDRQGTQAKVLCGLTRRELLRFFMIALPAAAIGWGLEEEAGYWQGKGDPLVHDFGAGVIFRDSAGTVSGTAYAFFGATGTFVHEAY
jgi:hypothetical protein